MSLAKAGSLSHSQGSQAQMTGLFSVSVDFLRDVDTGWMVQNLTDDNCCIPGPKFKILQRCGSVSASFAGDRLAVENRSAVP